VVKRKSGLPEHVTATIKSVIEKLAGLVESDDPDPKPEPEKPKNPDVRPAVEFFCSIHFSEFGRAPYLTMADRMALAKLHRELPDFKAIVTGYLQSTDPWIVKNGYAARLIPSQVEAIRKSQLVVKENAAKEWR